MDFHQTLSITVYYDKHFAGLLPFYTLQEHYEADTVNISTLQEKERLSKLAKIRVAPRLNFSSSTVSVIARDVICVPHIANKKVSEITAANFHNDCVRLW